MKEWYTAKELASALDVAHSTIVRKASRESWESQKRIGQGGGYEYHISNLPREARQALEAKQIADMLPQVANETRMVHSNDHSLTERQRTAADARTTVLNAIDAMNKAGISKQAAMTTLLTQATTGELAETSPVLDKALRMAKDTPEEDTKAQLAALNQQASKKDVVDQYVDQLHQRANKATTDMISQVKDLVDSAASLEDVREGLLAMELPIDQLADAMSEAMAAASLAGRYELLQDAE